MQRSLMQLLEGDDRTRLVKGLLRHIREHEDFSPNGCPVLLMYAYAKSRSLPCSWIHETLRELRDAGQVLVIKNHYQVNPCAEQVAASDAIADKSGPLVPLGLKYRGI